MFYRSVRPLRRQLSQQLYCTSPRSLIYSVEQKLYLLHNSKGLWVFGILLHTYFKMDLFYVIYLLLLALQDKVQYHQWNAQKVQCYVKLKVFEIASSTQTHFDPSEQSSICQNPVATRTGAGAGMFILYENVSSFFFLVPEITSLEYPMDK